MSIDESGPVELEMPDDRPEFGRAVRSMYRTPRMIVLAVLGLVFAWCFGWELPNRELARVHERNRECRVGLGPGGDPRPCDTSGQLRLAWLSPWTRARAHTLQSDIQLQIHGDLMERAGRVTLDPVARDAHALAYIETLRDHVDAHRYERMGLVGTLASAGALSSIEVAARALPEIPRSHGPRAAVAVSRGELDAASSMWRSPGPNPVEDPLQRAAWLCLAGERAAGLEVLASAAPRDADMRSRRGLLRVLCGDDQGEAAITWPVHEAWFAARRASEDPALAQRWLDHNFFSPHRLQVIAQALGHDEGPSTNTLLCWLARTGRPVLPHGQLLDIGAGVPAFALEDRRPRYSPATMLAASRVLLERADQLEGPRSPRCEGVDLNMRDPAAILRTSAGVMAAEASVELMLRAQLEPAAEAARVAGVGLPDEHAWLSAGLLIFAGASDEALATIEGLRASSPELEPAVALRLAELELRALTSMNEWARARERASIFAGAFAGMDGEAQALVGWCVALGIGEVVWTRPLRSGDPLTDLLRHVRELPADGDRLYQHIDVDRRRGDLSLILAARLVDEPGSIETWLDTTFIEQFETFGRMSLWQRAEAARWRWEVETERSWRARLATVQALIEDEDQALLAHYAGL